MTKEKLYEVVKRLSASGAVERLLIQCLDEFFESNVCIPKGKNRHPYADVLHEIIENSNGQRRQNLHGYKSEDWEDWKFYPCFEYRIKPCEPIYEWLYYDSEGLTDWLTEEEYEFMMETAPMECYRAEQTKRVRQ